MFLSISKWLSVDVSSPPAGTLFACEPSPRTGLTTALLANQRKEKSNLQASNMTSLFLSRTLCAMSSRSTKSATTSVLPSCAILANRRSCTTLQFDAEMLKITRLTYLDIITFTVAFMVASETCVRSYVVFAASMGVVAAMLTRTGRTDDPGREDLS